MSRPSLTRITARTPRLSVIAATLLLMVVNACATTHRQADRGKQGVGCGDGWAGAGLAPAFTGFRMSPRGQAGHAHRFHRDIALRPETPVDLVRTPGGAAIYEARTVIAYRTFEANGLVELRDQVRRMADGSAMSGPRLTSRDATGYRRAPFHIDYSAMDAATGGDGVAEGEDRFLSYSRWRIRTGWEDGAILTETRNGHVVYRFDPKHLYANLSSSTRLARWPGARNASPEQRATWERFSCELLAHEMLHLDTSRAVAANVLRELGRIIESSRERLEARFHFAWSSGIQWGREEDQRIDLYTGHGPILESCSH
jgi:hypothetical protein